MFSGTVLTPGSWMVGPFLAGAICAAAGAPPGALSKTVCVPEAPRVAPAPTVPVEICRSYFEMFRSTL
jgi:hypothetical protein